MQKDLEGRVQSVDRAMTLLEELGQAEDGYRLTDLARKTGLSLTTVHRLLTTLEQRHFVQFSSRDNLWHIGVGAFRVGTAFARDRHFIAGTLPYLRRLRDQTRETVNIGIVDHDEIVLLDQVPSREINRAISPVGGRTPMLASGMGKAILSAYSQDEVSALVRRRGMRRVTENTLTCPAALGSELARAKVEGFSVDDEEYRTGLRCIAAPIYGSRDEVVCAISVSSVSSRIPKERIPALGRLVARVAGELSSVLQTAPVGN